MKTAALALFVLAGSGWAAARVAIVAEPGVAGCARYGLGRLEKSLAEAGFELARGGGQAADFYVLAGIAPGGAAPESVVIRKTTHAGKPALLLRGGGARGLMYAALDAAESVTGGADPFARIREVEEQPYLRDRAVSMYTMQRAYFESRLYDEAYWPRYFDLLAGARINRFVVIFGYENGGFMAPPYPYFFDLPQFPEVRFRGLGPVQQQKNVAAFKALLRIAHERGIQVTPAIWDHIYRGGVQTGGIEGVTPFVSGVDGANLAHYTLAALRRFLEVFPEVDSIEFRMHDESGLRPSEMEAFWHQVFAQLHDARPEMPVILRAKGLPDSVIADALKQQLKFRIETKYWMEQMGLPFHPTHITPENQRERRHGYADLLREPQQYKVLWRLWTGGTARLLLWGDPDYVRRYVESARLYDGDAFEVNEMLATKMLGEPHDEAPVPILNAAYRYYDYEFERYWHFYQLWGRLSYNPGTPAETWEGEFRRRFGDEAGPRLMRALHLASGVLPRIVAASYPYSFFPTTRGWAEMMRLNDLPQYAAGHTTDTDQFMSARERARMILGGGESSLRTPEETADWFDTRAAAILAEVAGAHGAGKEYVSTVTDVRILAHLAEYHSRRLRAAVAYSLYEQSGNPASLDSAVALERQAVAAWERIVDAAGDVYSRQLPFGYRAGFPRHWSEELDKLRAGLAALEKRQSAVTLPRLGQAAPGVPLLVTAHAPAGSKVRLYYRHLTQFEDYRSVEMALDPGTGMYRAEIPAAFVTAEWNLMYFVEANGRRYPDLDIETPYVVVLVGKAR